MRAWDQNERVRLIQHWQKRFNLKYGWAFECAWMTLAMWDRLPEARHSLVWFASPRAHNLAESGLFTFKFDTERQFHHSLDFGWFKQSVHRVLEANLELFGKSIGAVDLGDYRSPKNRRRAYECLALRVCARQSPKEISTQPEYSRDWTTLFRDMKSAAELVGIRLPPRGRPARKPAR